MPLSYCFCLLTALPLFSQQVLTPPAEISLITIEPGEELYSVFGHTAFRVRDPVKRIDMVYNYGTFNFNTPNFYGKFLQGKLNYRLGKNGFNRSKMVYMRDNRGLKEQVLNLDSLQKQQLFDFLEHNYLPENREYLYDFFFDNCATRPRDVMEKIMGDKLQFDSTHLATPKSFRDVLDESLMDSHWGDFGIDLILGAKTDRQVKSREYMFIPEYLYHAFENAFVLTDNGSRQPLVKATEVIYQSVPKANKSSNFTNPNFIFWLLFVLVTLATAFQWFKTKSSRNSKAFSVRLIDAVLFFIAGLCGCLLLFMWFGTDHIVCGNNWNIGWLLPTHLVASVLLVKKTQQKWLAWYFLASAIICLFLLAFGSLKLLPQQFHHAFYPIMGVLAIRAFFIYMKPAKAIEKL